MSAQHPYRQLKIPPEAPFELKPSSGKGWGGHDITDDDVLKGLREASQDKISEFFLLKSDAAEILADLTHAFLSNHFALVLTGNLNAHHNDPTAQGLFILLSRFNHSCIPNASMPMNKGDSISCVASKDTRPGEEITFAYFDARLEMTRVRFQSKRSSEIATRALKQDTWLKKWQVASELYGRPDPSDHMASMELLHWRSKGMF
ncbi:SET domain-containing protein [Penicillium cataractarum]|uniref:SET domain-containing protein n=1 Tax=Penicillium cataractarum TaxID=2100454 RepID=A0A9W9SNC9_9EURO|nr:SET domain-containing protein [Penicillium cataractarum]KAJ5381676.1 SET domain-containing protein [Penicillium cataractarum]